MEKCCDGKCSCNGQDRVLTGARLLGFSFGTFGQMAPIGIYNVFSAYYYIYVIGLDPFSTMFGVFLSLLAFAISSTIFGVLADNKKPGKHGKRRPFLLVGIPGLFTFMILCWTPPSMLLGLPPDMGTAVYFWTVAVALETCQGLLVSTYLSLMTEQSTSPDNRVKIATMQGIFSILGTVLSILLPIILKSLAASGATLTSVMPWIGLAFGAIGFGAFLTVYFSTNEDFYLVNRETTLPKRTITQTFKDIFVPARDPQFRLWLGNSLMFNMAIRFLIFILMPLMEFVIQLQQSQYIIFFGCLLPIAATGYIIWVKKIKTSGLRNAYGLSLLVNVVFSTAAILLVIPMDFIMKFILGIVIVGILISSLVAGYLFPNPIVSRLVDLAPEEIRKAASSSSKGIAGSYFGLYLFTYNMAQAAANLLLGFIFTDQTKDDPFLIALMIPIAGAMTLVSWCFLRKIELTPAAPAQAQK
nr:MFS transporter [Candidatus Sigynarchaeota archaeon]